eukprot:CAMPEP_0182864784 /NCGR_PEP_ID=MMETSP0034_2-20130328/7346_1 /TAXON_ID=156128 /ORGANISM="Nephroselmis pyriformis, Strain CCMP717" /LENGTH=139 /DNA_ID=CAMNT_0024997047 /DNA_START=48 /DNA_END=466 /DNA_ORIENTATION=+
MPRSRSRNAVMPAGDRRLGHECGARCFMCETEAHAVRRTTNRLYGFGDVVEALSLLQFPMPFPRTPLTLTGVIGDKTRGGRVPGGVASLPGGGGRAVRGGGRAFFAGRLSLSSAHVKRARGASGGARCSAGITGRLSKV